MDLILASQLWNAVKANPALAIVIALFLVVAGVAMGYIVGNTSLRKKVADEYSKIAGRDLVKKSVLEEVGLGVIVYDKNGMVTYQQYKNTGSSYWEIINIVRKICLC